MENRILQVDHVEKTYVSKGNRYPVLKGISLSVGQGEFVAVMGPSGSGKTTLLNIISGFLSADGGEVRIAGENILKADKEKMAKMRSGMLGFVFQDFMLIDGLTVEENIFLPQIIAGKTEKAMRSQSDHLLSAFGISDIAGKYPAEISGGQKQRVAIARALSNAPALILADEPTGNLDSKSSNAVIEAFLMAKKNLNATIFMVTHDQVAASYADRVIALRDGCIVKEMVRDGGPREFMDRILEFLREVEVGV